MDVKVQKDKAKATLYLSGDIDKISVEKLKNFFGFVLEHKSIKEVCLDFKEVAAIDSTGINVILIFNKNFISGNGEKVIVNNLNEEMRGLFKILKLDQLLCVNGN